MANTKIKQE